MSEEWIPRPPDPSELRDWVDVLNRYETALTGGPAFEPPADLSPPPPEVHQRMLELKRRTDELERALAEAKERVAAELASLGRPTSRPVPRTAFAEGDWDTAL